MHRPVFGSQLLPRWEQSQASQIKGETKSKHLILTVDFYIVICVVLFSILWLRILKSENLTHSFLYHSTVYFTEELFNTYIIIHLIISKGKAF